jgi:hypothetical protein
MSEPGPDLELDDTLLREQAARLYTLYEGKVRSFWRALVAMAALMTFVFGLIFWPYTAFRGQEYAIERNLRELEAQQTDAATAEADFRSQVEYFREEHVAFVTFSNDELYALVDAEREHNAALDAVRTQLAGEPGASDWLAGRAERPALADTVRARISEIPADDSCFWLDGDDWWRCGAQLSLASIGRAAANSYGYSRISHLRNEMAAPLETSLSSAADLFGGWLAGERSTWRESGESSGADVVGEFANFTHSLDRLITFHLAELRDQHYELEQTIQDLNARISASQAELDRTRERIAEIAALQDIETPFGPLPVGVNDLIMLFPILLAAGFLLTVSLAAEVLELRQSYFGLARAKAPDFFTEKYVAMTAPVWVDPFRPRMERMTHTAILAMPIALFAASIGLLMSNGLLWGNFTEELRLGPWTYYAAYLVSVLLFVTGGRRFARQYARASLDRGKAARR